MKRNILKKAISLLLTLTMLIPLASPAFATEGIPAPVTEHEVCSAEELTAALNKVADGSWDAHTLKLTASIDYPHPISMARDSGVTIDLNGHTLTVQPASTAEPNINPMSNMEKIAAVYVHSGSLNLTGAGMLNVVAGDGVAYGVYAGESGSFRHLENPYYDPNYGHEVTVTSTGGGTAVYADDGGSVEITGSVSAEGDNAYAVQCFDGSNIFVSGNVSVTGNSAVGMYVESFDGDRSDARVGEDLTVSGEGSRAGIAGGNAWLFVFNNVTVTGNQSVGVSADGQESWIMVVGGITAPADAVSARDGGAVSIGNPEFELEEGGNVTVTDENATAVSAAGAEVEISGNVTSSGSGSTGISASAWDLNDPAVGAQVTVDGKIFADTPLCIEGLQVEESEGTEDPDRPVYRKFTDGTSTVWAKPGAFEKIPTFTVTFDKNGGDTEADPATKEVISGGNVDTLPTAPARSGYTFNGWNTKENGSGTAFAADTAVTGSITVYAQWGRNSSGGGSSGGSGGTSIPIETPKTETNVAGNTATAATKVTAAPDSSGNAAATVSRAQVSDAIGKAMEEAEKQGEDTVARVEIKVEVSADAAAVETSIPKEAIDQASEAGIGALTISTPVARITFDANTLSALSEEAAGDLKITVSRVEASSLSPEAQRTVGDRPVFDFRVTSGGRTISQFGGDVSVSVPYTPKEGEDTNAIVIYYINDSGGLEIVSNCIYDPATGSVRFSTRHFSQYAVGYNNVTLKDVAENAWYGKAAGFIAAREITTGTGGGNFSPEAKQTRGQFIVMLMKAYGIAPDADSKDNFADAGTTYYTGYLAAAKRLSISGGVGNNLFAPDREITRQEMFTLLYNALKVIGKLPQGDSGKTLDLFSDAGQIDSWAKEAMTLLVETGTIGGNGGKLSPASTATRAEMAQVLYNLLSEQSGK
ncbi:MAG: S-layer homology domain-containing protein [Eubacteriales bacterium]|nr:S-layer homology domain-containing protein [Eubacteriales bacterium]